MLSGSIKAGGRVELFLIIPESMPHLI